MDTLTAITIFKDEYTKMIESFSVLDKSDPLTPQKIKNIASYLNRWTELLEDSLNDFPQISKNFTLSNQKKETLYLAEIDELKNSYNQRTVKITEEKKGNIGELEKEIQQNKKETAKIIEQLEQDLHYFLMTSEQNSYLLENDYEEAKKRYDYQKEEAKASYLEIVEKNNRILEEKKQKINEIHQDNTDRRVKHYQEEIASLNNQIKLKEAEVSSLMKILQNERNATKEKYRQESILLNTNIQKIAAEKNRIIDKAKNQYSKAQSDESIERENKRQNNLGKSQAILKEFVTKINDVDEIMNKKKKEYEEANEVATRQYLFDRYQKTFLYHRELEEIYKTYSKPFDRSVLKLLKFKQKKHKTILLLLKKEYLLKQQRLKKTYNALLTENKNTKNYLEIDKNFATKKITMQEQYENKYFQKRNDIFENDYSYIVQSANYTFSQKANILRSQSQIEKKLYEKNFDRYEASYYKKIETVQTKIRYLKAEIDLENELNQYQQTFEEKKYTNALHQAEVSSLLEIEKNKRLKEYNDTQYGFNVRFITLTKEYGNKKIGLENQREEKIKTLNEELEQLLLDKKIYDIRSSIEKNNLQDRFEKLKLSINNQNDIKEIKEKYQQQLYQSDFDLLDILLRHYTRILQEIPDKFHYIANTTLKGQSPSLANISYFKNFLNSFGSMFLTLYRNILLSFKKYFSLVIEERIRLIEKLKYQSSYEILKENHLLQTAEIKNKKNQLLDQIDSYTKTLTNFKQKIFTIINDNAMLLENRKNKTKKLDAKTQEIIKENNLKIKEYREKSEQYQKMLLMNTEDLKECNLKLRQLADQYKKEKDKIDRMRKKDVTIYMAYQDRLGKFIKENRIHQTFQPLTNKEKDPMRLFKECRNLQKKLYSLCQTTIMKMSLDFQQFKNRQEQKNHLNERQLKKAYKANLKSYRHQYKKAQRDYTKKNLQTLKQHQFKIEHQQRKIASVENYYKHIIDKNYQTYLKDGKTLNQLFHNQTKEFFTAHYAATDNNQAVLNYHQATDRQNETNFKKAKSAALKEKDKQKKEMQDHLNQFIRRKNEEIEHLPKAYKYNIQLIHSETKKKNNEIHLAIKENKNHFNQERKKIDKELSALKNTLKQETLLAEIDYQKELKQIKNK